MLLYTDFQECNPNIKQGHTVIKFVRIKIKSQSSVCHFQIGMGAPLVINSTRMEKIISSLPNISSFVCQLISQAP